MGQAKVQKANVVHHGTDVHCPALKFSRSTLENNGIIVFGTFVFYMAIVCVLAQSMVVTRTFTWLNWLVLAWR